MRGILVRLDDITPDMDWDRFYQLKEIFDQYGIKPLLGIVPDNQDAKLHKQDAREDFWDVMISLQKQGWVLSQHGYQHIYVNHEGGLLKLNKNSEFAGLPLQEQQDKLAKGKQLLKQHGIETDIFMAPSHSYDKVTIEALKQTGFRYVTDGYGCNTYQYRGLGFVPCTLTRYQHRKGVDTICIHANTMTEKMIEQLSEDIQRHRSEFLRWQDVLQNMPKKNIAITLGEEKELLQRRVKAFVANSKAFQAYMQQTNDANRYKKICKRAILFPITLLKALGEK